MNHSTHSAWPPITKLVRWGARILSVLILLFWGIFVIGHLVGDAGSPSRLLVAYDYILMATMIASLVGLAVAWKWEFAGAILTLIAVVIGAVINWRVLLFPIILIPFTACLFLLSWWLHRTRIDEPTAPAAMS